MGRPNRKALGIPPLLQKLQKPPPPPVPRAPQIKSEAVIQKPAKAPQTAPRASIPPPKKGSKKAVQYDPSRATVNAPLQPEAPRAAPPKPSRWVPRGRMIPLLGAGSVVFALGVYCAWSYNSLRSVPAETVPQDVTDRYNPTMARNFDSDNERTEYWQGILKLRKRLAQEASGHVLEVSAGTGRNTEFYDLKKCRSLTLVDQSASMLEEARKKWQEWRESRPPFNRPREEAMRLVNADALKEIPPAPPSAGVKKEEGEPDYYDTVVQTMGLCSTPEPEKLLEKMGDAVKDDGRILLLEHGKAKYNWLNSLLDKTAAGHADRYGCWWNKDIDGIVRRAKGLEVVEIKRKHFGTTWWVELRKTQEAIKERKEEIKRRRDSAVAVADLVDAAKEAVGVEQPRKSWWQVWKW